MSLDAVGEAPTAPVLGSAAYSMDVGFAHSYPPPGEVQQVAVLGDKATLVWAPELSVGTYRVYSGDLDRLSIDYGVCRTSGLTVEHVPLREVPDVGQAFFYLVTARNRLHEEGITGYDSAGALRVNPAPCP